MRSTFAWREPDVGRRLATVRRTYSWELPRWHELEYDAAGWPRLGARHVPKLRL